MKRKPALTFALVISAALVLGGVLGVTALANGGYASANGTFLAAASPSPSPRSNETAAHEQNETAAQEAAENNGTFHPTRRRLTKRRSPRPRRRLRTPNRRLLPG